MSTEREYQSRVRAEREDLDHKREKLADFMGSEKFQHIADAERLRLSRQYTAMTTYSAILSERIEAFE